MRYSISIIIINFNGKRYIDNLFSSLKNLNSTVSHEILFVDNNSVDDSVEYLENLYQDDFPNLKIIRSEKNLGFAGGNNYGAQFAEGEYLVFLNNDTAVPPNWLEELYNFVNMHSDAGIVSSKLVFYYDFLKVRIQTRDKILLSNKLLINGIKKQIEVKFTSNLLYGEKDLTCFGHTYFYIPLINGETQYTLDFDVIQGHDNETDYFLIGGQTYPLGTSIELDSDFINKNKVTLIQNAGSGIDKAYNGYDVGFCEEERGQYELVTELESCCGAAMLIKRELFQKIGGFDDHFFMYYEDTDLSLRVRGAGYKLYLCPNAPVRHIHTGSSQEWSPFFVYYVYRNRLLFIFKNYSFLVFVKQFAATAYHVLKEVIFTRQKRVIKLTKIRALLGAIIRLPNYFLKKT